MPIKKRIKWYKILLDVNSLDTILPIGSAREVEVNGKSMCLSRTDKGIYAVDNKCPHQGALLSSGKCTDANEIVCPWHRYSFDLETGKQTNETNGLAIKTFPTKIENGNLLVGVKKTNWSLF